MIQPAEDLHCHVGMKRSEDGHSFLLPSRCMPPLNRYLRKSYSKKKRQLAKAATSQSPLTSFPSTHHAVDRVADQMDMLLALSTPAG